MKYPSPLVKGSRIAVTAFSSGVPEALHKRLDIVLANLKNSGFEVVEGSCLRENVKHVSSSAQLRAQELMNFLCDDSIAAVAPPWGGEFAMDILPLLDYERLKAVKPKWVFGFSDVSTVSVALMSKLGWSTVHSSNLMDLHPDESDLLISKTLHWLGQNEGSQFIQQSSESYQLDGSLFADDPDYTLNKTEATAWKVVTKHDDVNFSGRLIGGCFDTMTHLIGTEYFDIEILHDKFSNDGVILYLENAEMSPTVLKRALQSLKYKGVFDRLNGLLFGRNAVTDNCGKAVSCEEVFIEVTKDLDIPVVYDVDIGHLPPNMTLLNGAYAEVFVKKGAGTILQRLR
ncbi:S66 family peptidase [Psychromonas aquimarina]|uniref:S66 family peptidase n=1 Tax=Psychromonas aquimarina TaxID=444919 RepID=UPI000410B5C1|nr:S66 peptidase family protein [Psychromonas aquimarina]